MSVAKMSEHDQSKSWPLTKVPRSEMFTGRDPTVCPVVQAL